MSANVPVIFRCKVNKIQRGNFVIPGHHPADFRSIFTNGVKERTVTAQERSVSKKL